MERSDALAERFAAEAAACERLFLVGIGTSHHAARVGEHLFRAYGGGLDARAVHSFDFALYGPEVTARDCVVAVSHRGSKRYTAAALRRAREAGSRTALVTGEGATVSVETDAVFETVPQERSSAHTVSYTSAVAVLALLAALAGRLRTGSETLEMGFLREEIPAALREALGTEDEARALAGEHVGRRRIWLAGGGPSAVTAEETALKIKETSYLQAEGMPTETMLHGPFQCVEAEDLFVLVAPSGAAQGRTLEVADLAGEVGAPSLVVSDGTAGIPGGASSLAVREVPEPFSALACLVPLQLFAYHLALARGTNPDSFRAEDPRFARADVSGRL
ncbi:Glutamine-fructose-6-phosphate transaminase (isomerizing) [Rubrobacter xylanophilus DSM 9941]|uniref:Glutamine--fructose-6-phosphate aminotransferase [isomerizing] n=1 Tax=Rubrobacter xylanophilus (strain DSM 9941 / JCM 11954 / NBRC 16129 / PRD-1) TaxID=266117 RepID=Q1AZR2_RUBXD|nr:SIS domain-containing protein [Rubrobacter xylanophilus]ABG03116.1 Glutamine-fructose-6-phosphate transaminase (isomerizing) [Rubrobacter xylanophilus DSM 9941]